ncbi:putative isomerase [Drosera capensis]
MAKPRGDVVKYALVDAFADAAFKGNPAAVCVLEKERSEEWMQTVAREFNISATCFLIRVDENVARFNLRWFTPVAQLKICGHATLAASHFCFTTGLASGDVIEFSTLSGILTAKRVQGINKSDSGKHENGLSQPLLVIELDFPTIPLTDYNSFETFSISKALGGAPVIDVKRTTTDDDLFVVLASAEAVKNVQPQTEDIRQCSGRGIIISGQALPESGFDFFSRFFCPKLGIIEDPVCGSAHCALAPYWSKRLNKENFVAFAASPRSGTVKLHLDEENNRVKLQGTAVTVMEGSVLA